MYLFKKPMVFDSRGFALIEVLISSGMSLVVALATISLFVMMMRELNVVQKKAELIEFKNLLVQSFQNSENCTWQLKDKVINVSSVTTADAEEPISSPTEINFGELRQGKDSSSSILVKAGEILPTSNFGIKVHEIKMKKIFAVDGSDDFRSIIEISFVEPVYSRALKPVQFVQVFNTVPGGDRSSARINGCGRKPSTETSGTTGSGTISFDMGDCRRIVTPNTHPAGVAVATCPTDYKIVSGGCSHFWPGANSIPDGENGWYCSNTSDFSGGIAYALCCKVN